MASFLDKFKLKTAMSNYTELDLSSDHITTANFMQFNVAFAQELVPNQSININMDTFVRLQPLPVPTFGRARVQNRCFFVPYRTIFPAWQDFITDARHTDNNGNNSIPTSVPVVSNQVLTDFFTGRQDTGSYVPRYGVAGNVIPHGTDDPYDYYTLDRYKVKLTQFGRWAMKLLNSLGYSLQFGAWNLDNFIESNQAYYSALPLLAVAKVYADWYFPSHYASTPEFARLEEIFNRDNGNYNLSQEDITVIFDFLRKVNYDSDYFTSAWQNPVTPNDGTYSNMQVADITSQYNYVVNSGDRPIPVNNNIQTGGIDGTPIITNEIVEQKLGGISQYAIDCLKAMTDYIKRHQLVGGRALDRYLARFGVKLSDEQLRRSVYVGTAVQNIQFGDVMSTASTDDSKLGAYAGKGIGYCQGNFSFDNEKDYGILIIVSTIVPKAGYFQGIDRNVLHTSRLDYWTPEFDNLGVQAISKSELYVPTSREPWQIGMPQPQQYLQSVFGFTPRYAEYKIGKDRLSGDFRYNSINAGTESWTTMRFIEPANVTDLVISSDFVSGDDSDQYNRIFYADTEGEYDKFNVIHSFDIKSRANMKSLYDTYDFANKGNEVMLQANGVKMN